ncbi:hypothetical protein K449DRAFT_389135 [Hypoxylon sp. EC38]|nr:hypothetical protein K449DRAFT_389135 [Hypoxylon sp. EC38]
MALYVLFLLLLLVQAIILVLRWMFRRRQCKKLVAAQRDSAQFCRSACYEFLPLAFWYLLDG